MKPKDMLAALSKTEPTEITGLYLIQHPDGRYLGRIVPSRRKSKARRWTNFRGAWVIPLTRIARRQMSCNTNILLPDNTIDKVVLDEIGAKILHIVPYSVKMIGDKKGRYELFGSYEEHVTGKPIAPRDIRGVFCIRGPFGAYWSRKGGWGTFEQARFYPEAGDARHSAARLGIQESAIIHWIIPHTVKALPRYHKNHIKERRWTERRRGKRSRKGRK